MSFSQQVSRSWFGVCSSPLRRQFRQPLLANPWFFNETTSRIPTPPQKNGSKMIKSNQNLAKMGIEREQEDEDDLAGDKEPVVEPDAPHSDILEKIRNRSQKIGKIARGQVDCCGGNSVGLGYLQLAIKGAFVLGGAMVLGYFAFRFFSGPSPSLPSELRPEF